MKLAMRSEASLSNTPKSAATSLRATPAARNQPQRAARPRTGRSRNESQVLYAQATAASVNWESIRQHRGL